MCFKAAPGIRYLKCYDLVQEPEKVFRCDEYPNGKDCKDPKINHSVTAKEVKEYCPDCVAAGKK